MATAVIAGMQDALEFGSVGTDPVALRARKVVENQTLETDLGAREHEAVRTSVKHRRGPRRRWSRCVRGAVHRRFRVRPLPDRAPYDRQSKPTTRTVNQKGTSA
ncbi:hypothetical protein [Streptomyces sp. NPDC001296]